MYLQRAMLFHSIEVNSHITPFKQEVYFHHIVAAYDIKSEPKKYFPYGYIIAVPNRLRFRLLIWEI